jgi:proteasome lid subunit RPN8/RPN11
MRTIEDGGEDVVGFYHSHPSGPPRPSQTDTARATWEGYSYVIVSLDGQQPYVGSWRWTGDHFEQEVVAIGHASAAKPT